MSTTTPNTADATEDLNVPLEYRTLRILHLLHYDQLYKAQIADRLEIKKQTATRRVNDLNDAGLVTPQIVDREDENGLRVVYATSEQGEAVLDRYAVCMDSDCREVVSLDDHQHEWAVARDAFASE